MLEFEGFVPGTEEEKEKWKKIIASAINMLPRVEKKIIEMRYFMEMDIAEIAKSRRISEDAVKERLGKARKAIGEVLDLNCITYTSVVAVLIWFYRQERIEKGIPLTAKIEFPKTRKELLKKYINKKTLIMLVLVIALLESDFVETMLKGDDSTTPMEHDEIITVNLNDYVDVCVLGDNGYAHVFSTYIDHERLADDFGDRARYLKQEDNYYTLLSSEGQISAGMDVVTEKQMAESMFGVLNYAEVKDYEQCQMLSNGDKVEIQWVEEPPDCTPMSESVELIEKIYGLDLVYEDFVYVVEGLEEEF